MGYPTTVLEIGYNRQHGSRVHSRTRVLRLSYPRFGCKSGEISLVGALNVRPGPTHK